MSLGYTELYILYRIKTCLCSLFFRKLGVTEAL